MSTLNYVNVVLQFADHVWAYDKIPVTDKLMQDNSCKGLWLEKDKQVMICTFRICNFLKARFSPQEKWKALISAIIEWLCQVKPKVSLFHYNYQFKKYNENKSLEEQVVEAVNKGIEWYGNAGILRDNGNKGVYEGLKSEIYPDGTQHVNTSLRADCIGESALPFFMHHLLTGNKESLDIARNLTRYMYANYMVKEGLFKGMIRWTSEGWGVCYQDDVARAVLPSLLISLYTGKEFYLKECVQALDFLVKTTGTDGLRKSRTDNIFLNEVELKRLSEMPGNCVSPHYNGYYLAVLLIAYKLTGIEKYKEVAVKGLTTLMARYPDIDIIQSLTQETCRLVLPLSLLYWVTGDAMHKRWLYKVIDQLEKHKHKSGGYLEWDEGYKAQLYNAGKGNESAIFAKNGDPVTDSLYSMNWLPIAFMHAYFATSDVKFKRLWEEIAKFYVSVQVHSDNKLIDGAWCRAVDVEKMEVFGLPYDIGWGPWSIETGWTMSQIISGLALGLLEERLKTCF